MRGLLSPGGLASAASIDLSIRDYSGLDAGGGSDMSALINNASATASSLATAGGYPHVVLGGFRRGVYRVDSQLLIPDKVRFDFGEARIVAGADFGANTAIFRALDGVGNLNPALAQGTGTTTNNSQIITALSNPSLWREEHKISGVNIPAGAKVLSVDTVNASLVIDTPATGSGNTTLTRAATYYGNYRNCGLIGGEIDPNGHLVGPIIRMMWTEGAIIDGTRFLHNRGATAANWAMQVGGRNLFLRNFRVVGGTRLSEDGLHIMHGQHIRVQTGDIESGDDSIAIGGVVGAGEPTTNTDPDPIRHVTIANMQVQALRGSPVKVYVQSTATGRDWEITNVHIDGVVGSAGQYRNGGIFLEDANNPAYGTSQIRHVVIRGARLNVGGPGHDGTNKRSLYIQSVQDSTIEADFTVDPGGVGTHTVYVVNDSDGVQLDCKESVLGGTAYTRDAFLRNGRLEVV